MKSILAFLIITILVSCNTSSQDEFKAIEYLNKKGNKKFKQLDYNGAMQDYTLAIKLNPISQQYLNRGLVQSALKDYERAIEDFSKVIEIISNKRTDYLKNQNLVKAYHFRGLAKFMLTDYNGAIKDFDKVIEINPLSLESYNYRGKANTELKNFEGAIKDCNEAINISSNNENAYIKSLVLCSKKF